MFFLVYANWQCWEQEENEVKTQGWRTAHIRKKQEWQNKLKNLRIGRKEVEDQDKVEDSAMAAPFYDENFYILKAKQEQEAKVSSMVHLFGSVFVATGIVKGFYLPVVKTLVASPCLYDYL
jgi:hypothetical protein